MMMMMMSVHMTSARPQAAEEIWILDPSVVKCFTPFSLFIKNYYVFVFPWLFCNVDDFVM